MLRTLEEWRIYASECITSEEAALCYFNAVFDILKDWKEDKTEIDRLKRALKEISKGEGAYSLDPLTHAANTIESMKETAKCALEQDLEDHIYEYWALKDEG